MNFICSRTTASVCGYSALPKQTGQSVPHMMRRGPKLRYTSSTRPWVSFQGKASGEMAQVWLIFT